MDREWLTERELLDWLAGRLAGLKICQKCDNPAKDAAVGLLRLRVPAPDRGQLDPQHPLSPLLPPVPLQPGGDPGPGRGQVQRQVGLSRKGRAR